MFKYITTTALVLGISTSAVVAQAKCAPREKFVTQLAEKYKETMGGAGLSSATQVVEFWASEETGTFSILITNANGVSCIVAAGKNWVDTSANGKTDPAT